MKSQSFLAKLTVLWAVAFLSITMPMRALDAQRLADTVAAQLGFNYAVRITYADLTNSASANQIRLFPRAGFAPAGLTVTRVGIYPAFPFSFTAANAASNVVDVSIGYAGTGNTAIFSGITKADTTTSAPAFTNCSTGRVLGAATNWIAANIVFTNNSTLTNGDLYIYLHLADLQRATNSL